MEPNIEQYLTDLLGQTITKDSRIHLTSGQRARLASWCESNAINIDRSVIKRAEFVVGQAIGESDGSTQRGSQPPTKPIQLQSGDSQPQSIKGVGIDIQSIDELIPDAHDFKENQELRHIFSLREISYAETRSDPRETLAGLFAAKESVRKADPDFFDMPLDTIEVLPNHNGAPEFNGFSISISHSAGIAVACAIRHSQASSAEHGETSNGSGSLQTPNQADSGTPAASPSSKHQGPQKTSSLKLALVLLLTLVIGMSIPTLIESAWACRATDTVGCKK